VESHLEQCASCRHAVAEAVRVLSSQETAVGVDTRRSSKRIPPWLVGIAALAASVVAVTLARPVIQRGGANRVEREVNGPAGEGLPLLRVYTPANGVRLQTSPTVFQWASTERVDRYRFALSGADATPIWSADVTDTVVTLPDEIVQRLRPGQTYLWHVDALRGGREATTRTRSFSIER
jgi:hypothetical protein